MSNTTRKFTKSGGKNSHTDTVYGRGGVVRVPDSSGDEDGTQPPKPKKAKKTALVAKAGNVLKVSNTVTASQPHNAMTLNADPTATQANNQPQTSGSSAPSAIQNEDMLKTARKQSNLTTQANGKPNENSVEPDESDTGRQTRVNEPRELFDIHISRSAVRS